MITLTESAINAVQRFLSKGEVAAQGLRVSIAGGGCSGFQYGLRIEPQIGADDVVVECGGVKVVVDPVSASMLDGVEIDFVESIEGSGFKFHNPNATATCACGSSFSA